MQTVFLGYTFIVRLAHDLTALLDAYPPEPVAKGKRQTVSANQRLNEFSSVARRKLGMSWAEIREVLTTIRVLCRVETLGLETHETGLALAERHGFAMR